MNSKHFWSFDDFNSFGFWLLLTLKLTISVIGTGGMVGIKLEKGSGWKGFAKW